MGYTHYWYRPQELPKERWDAFLADWIKLHDALVLRGLALAGWSGQPGDPSPMNGHAVSFNGAGRASCEDFTLLRVDANPFRRPDGRSFGFCKTNRMPYDLAVTACLVAAKRHFRDLIEVCTDGLDADWREARELCQGVLGYGGSFHIGEDRKLTEALKPLSGSRPRAE